MSIKEQLDEILADVSPSDIEDPTVRRIVFALLNLVEELNRQNKELEEENRRLREENRRLKDQSSPPEGSSGSQDQNDISSEEERSSQTENEETGQESKIEDAEIHEEVELEIDEEVLPEDARLKYWDTHTMRGIQIEPHNIRFRIPVYYSPAREETYRPEVPSGCEGGFNPQLIAFVRLLGYEGNVSEERIQSIVGNFGVDISAGQINRILTEELEDYHREAFQVHRAGMEASSFCHFDQTGAKEDGGNRHANIFSTPFCTVFRTTDRKDRLSSIKALYPLREYTYRLDGTAVWFCEQIGLARSMCGKMEEITCQEDMTEEQFEEYLEEHLPDLKDRQRKWIKEGALLASLWAREEVPDPGVLVCDDAPQFRYLAHVLALCWIHEGRHYKKLSPLLELHREKRQQFLEEFWNYYGKLLDYKREPSEERRQALAEEFERIFSTETGYEQLDRRIENTKDKKERLLAVLANPEVPLHNNPAELGARKRVRKRKISYGTRSRKGTKARDTFLTLLSTCKKLSVNFFDYLLDRIKEAGEVAPLEELIRQKARDHPAGVLT